MTSKEIYTCLGNLCSFFIKKRSKSLDLPKKYRFPKTSLTVHTVIMYVLCFLLAELLLGFRIQGCHQ